MEERFIPNVRGLILLLVSHFNKEGLKKFLGKVS